MACSGINEHAEGCRKQRVLDRSAHTRKLMMEGLVPKDVLSYRPVYSEEEAPGYMRKMGSPPGISSPLHTRYNTHLQGPPMIDMVGNHSPTAIDRLRRDAVRAQQLVAYSAKIPNRLSSVNYAQQW
ncbi:uncharacterized protein LOC143292105 [Babylonia areolata]|uniref:uncharacterized protein LOC143292105 n=1 Tax=Babylonia areolata TaxID=304850 RepID=UPI003FD52470